MSIFKNILRFLREILGLYMLVALHVERNSVRIKQMFMLKKVFKKF